MIEVNINCDLGEGTSNEASIMPYIQSCNIACGGHVGNRNTIAEAIQIALKNDVAIGAHPSYPDVENFGRVSMSISNEDLVNTIQKQMKLFDEVLSEYDATLHHIKPHGALYNDIAKDDKLAIVFLSAIADYKNRAAIYVPFGSVVAKKALEEGFTIYYEAFADRAYNDDLSLVSRKLPNSLITDKNQVLEQIMHIKNKEAVISINNKAIPMEAATFCVHSDTENAIEIVEFLYKNFQTANIG
ncbi:5-oxoprolinase subunit PxpA [Joostella atrarenae]|uniref:5-oxoprolinase subunit PxpA n=1 Tax=Joostella atrarenae TaxID=679257 RepID=A0ABS9J1D2_9FLAO|nr:5-oxoprolinase subunit PxpA [Joostella atrarenae]MCF8714226.1 5-oxoprolinase subunit PxpA [Joostella atrarenae]